MRTLLPISPESWGISHPPLEQPGQRFQVPSPSDLERWQGTVWQGVKGHPLAPWWPQGLRSSLGLHLPALFLFPVVEGDAHSSSPAWVVLSWSRHKKEHLFRWRLLCRVSLPHCAPHCSTSSPHPRAPNQLAESFSEMHLRCGYNNEKSSMDTNAPPEEWTPGPLSSQPASQSLRVCLAPLPFPPLLLSTFSLLPSFPLCFTNLSSGFHKQGVLGRGMLRSKPLYFNNESERCPGGGQRPRP